jgi:NitT/TauT family transport system substrate-binding protein
MADHKQSFVVSSIICTLALAACGGAAAPASAPASQPAASAAVSASAKPAASGLVKVKAAYSQVSAVQGALYAGVDQKIFAKYGLDVEVLRVAGTQQVPAMQAGELQFGTPGGNEIVSADLGGANQVMIAVASNYPVFSLFGSKGVNDVKDLAGKTVAITTAGSSTDASAQIFLKQFGLDKQVKRQPAATIEGILAVMEKGEVAGGVVSPPTTVLAEKAGLKELVNGPKLGVPLIHSSVSVTRDYLKSKPDLVMAFLQGYVEAWKFVIDPANEAATVQTIAKWTQSDADVAKAAYQYVQPAWAKNKLPAVDAQGVKNILEVVENPKAKDAKPEEFFDNSLLESLAK